MMNEPTEAHTRKAPPDVVLNPFLVFSCCLNGMKKWNGQLCVRFQGGVIDRENSLGDRHGEVRSRRSLRGEDDVTLQSPTVRVAIDIDSSSSLQRVGRFDQVYWNVLSLCKE
ncbi:hypothetical protein B296_00045390 [Ensete ventricosum]|uniref:Uncharacterized protein n=1 Tax=Ensete ventricosum TaxID=4639 RepID=A0A426Z7M2_ENSVE|nr:hypothetical protein B296_00045390 [Ensete ventricosum]